MLEKNPSELSENLVESRGAITSVGGDAFHAIVGGCLERQSSTIGSLADLMRYLARPCFKVRSLSDPNIKTPRAA